MVEVERETYNTLKQYFFILRHQRMRTLHVGVSFSTQILELHVVAEHEEVQIEIQRYTLSLNYFLHATHALRRSVHRLLLVQGASLGQELLSLGGL